MPAYLQQTVPGRAVLTLLLGTALLLAGALARWPTWLCLAAAGPLLWGLGGLGHGATQAPVSGSCTPSTPAQWRCGWAAC